MQERGAKVNDNEPNVIVKNERINKKMTETITEMSNRLESMSFKEEFQNLFYNESYLVRNITDTYAYVNLGSAKQLTSGKYFIYAKYDIASPGIKVRISTGVVGSSFSVGGVGIVTGDFSNKKTFSRPIITESGNGYESYNFVNISKDDDLRVFLYLEHLNKKLIPTSESPLRIKVTQISLIKMDDYNPVVINELKVRGNVSKFIVGGAKDYFARNVLEDSSQLYNKLKKRQDGIIFLTDYGYIGDGISNPLSKFYKTLDDAKADYPVSTSLTDEIDWCALQQALNDANAQQINKQLKGVTVEIPRSKGILNRQLHLQNVGLFGDPRTTELHFERFGNGDEEVSAVLVDCQDNQLKHARIENIIFTGDGRRGQMIGEISTKLNGVECIGDSVPVFSHCQFRYFYKGTVWNNSGGHINYENCFIEENYYGIYCLRNNGDYRLFHTSIQSNQFACIGTKPASGIQGLYMVGGHIGFTPFGFYCEPTPSTPDQNENRNIFLKDCLLEHMRFEGIGNAMIYSDYSQGADPLVSGLNLIHVGFEWHDNDWRFYDFPREYAIDIVRAEGAPITIDMGAYGIQKGELNRIRVRNLQTSINVLGASSLKANDITVDSGTGLVSTGNAYHYLQYDGMSIPKSTGGAFCEVIENGETVSYSPFFMNDNPNKRYKFFIMVDFPGDCFGTFFFEGGNLYPVANVGSFLSYGKENPTKKGKLNVYSATGGTTIGITNLLGSDRKVSISIEGFY